MRTDHLIAGAVLLVVGLLGLLALYGRTAFVGTAYAEAYLGYAGALALFALLAIAGLVVLYNGRTPYRVVHTVHEVHAEPDFSMVVLRYLSIGRTPSEIAAETGVSRAEVNRRIDELYHRGCITSQNRITEKGYEELNREETTTVVHEHVV